VAGGGAAGVNILTIAKELGCDNVILPKVASALSAAGMQNADIVAEEAASHVTRSDRFDFEGVNATFAELDRRLNAFRETLPKIDAQKVTYEYIAECRYLAQVWELDAPIGKSRFEGQADLDAFVENFHQIHERVFAMRDDGSPVEVVNWKARLIVSLASPPQDSPAVTERRPDSPSLTRNCYFGTAEAVKTPIYKAEDLKPGDIVAGPAIIEEPTTT
ncbi:MAG: hydantoinase/oxoprolinase family protein, partial [Alphaproteobacteria bacterium]